MKPTNNVCLSESEISLLLSSDLPPDETASAEHHIAECETCRSAIESMIADSRWWDDARHSLAASANCTLDGSHVAASRGVAEEDGEDLTSLGETRLRVNVLDLLGPTDDPNMLGRIGPYEIIGLLGQGGMGAVFKGFDRSLNRFVAIKLLLPHLAASGAARKRFAREGQAVAAVVDDHVMAIHCVDEWQGVPYLVMTYSRGCSLQKRLSDNGPLEVREILRIGMQAAKGLAAAHAQGIVHRDIKPANIFLDQNVERVQLMDFGLARAVDDASLTRSGTLAGTPQYMSPEQARAETVDHRSDLFSLGSVLYAMCTGHAPFRAESSYSVLRLITDKEPRLIREINSDIPEWLCTIISKLMAKQANDRLGSAQEVAQLLEDCLAHVQQPTVKELPGSLIQHLLPKSSSTNRTGVTQRFNRSGIRNWLLAGISVTAIVLIAMMLQNNGPQRSGQSEPGPLTGAHANLGELQQHQKAREESIRQISYHGIVRQYARQDIQRTNTESVDEFVARCVGLVPVYDEFSPYPLSASRDFSSGVYRFTMGDIKAGIPEDIKYMDWFIEKGKYVQLMGREPGACEAVVTNNREDIRDDREASLVRLDIAAFRPVKDILLSEVLKKAISEPGIPDVGGRPLWKLEKLNNKVGWKATFMFQQPIAKPPGAKQILWYRVYWESIGGELVIVRVDKLTVDGDENSTPQSVTLIDDYRSVCGKPVPFRVRCFVLGDSFVQGAELTVSDLKVNDYVDVPDQMQIPAGSSVRNQITGVKSRQPASKISDPTTDAELIQGTWNVLELQQVGYEASEAERNIYKNGGYKITFTKNKTIHSPDHSSMDYRVDTTQTPHVLELLQAGKVIAKAIYELTGDDLKMCQGRTPTDGSDPEPPTSFDINQAPTKFPSLYILRRTKPIEPVAIPNDLEKNQAKGASDCAVVMVMHPAELRNGNTIQRAAATKTVGLLTNNDFCDILRYGSGKPETNWLWSDGTELRKIGQNREKLLAAIAESFTGDFPSLEPAFKMALEAFQKVNAKQKLMIVFTDGDPLFVDATLIDRFREAGIKVSVIHVDIHRIKDRPLLKRLVEATGGTYHYALESQATVVESLFVKEVQSLRSNSNAALQKIAVAFHMIHDKVGSFPGSHMKHLDRQSNEFEHPYSWRVAILPFIGQQQLFEKYRFDEPWDSDNNLALLKEMPNLYRSPHAPADQPPGNSNMLGIATESGGLGLNGGEAMSSFTDGTSNTILIVETAHSVPWTKPEDLTDSKVEPVVGHPLRFVLADGSVGEMSPIDAGKLEKMITRNGGEVIGMEPADNPKAAEQPALGKVLQHLQGKWQLSRQIAPDGDESSMPSQSVWEFKGDRYIVRDGGPGGAGLIEVDDSHSPAHVKMTIEIDEVSGLGLMSVEGDKANFCMGKLQKTPEPSSRPEKLQWVAGVYYMELTRMKPGEVVVPLKPAVVLPMAETVSNPLPKESQAPEIDHRNARSVVEAYVASAFAGDVAKAAALAKNSPADPKRIRELPEFLNVQRLKIETVYVNDPAKSTRALATSVVVKLDEDHKNPDGRRDGFLVFTLELTDDKWFVIDIDFETESGAEKELKKFIQDNPNSIGLPPTTRREHGNEP